MAVIKDIDDRQMPLLDHLIELRNRLMYSCVAIMIGFLICYFFSEQIYAFLVRPLADIYQGQTGRRMIYTGLAGSRTAPNNFAPAFVYIGFWMGLVPLSLLFGDVYRWVNPWRAVGRVAGTLARRVVRGEASEPLPYPPWLGYWPAVAGLVLGLMAFAGSMRGGPRSHRRLALWAVLFGASDFVLGLDPAARFSAGVVSSEAYVAHGLKLAAFIALASWLWTGTRSSLRLRFVVSFGA